MTILRFKKKRSDNIIIFLKEILSFKHTHKIFLDKLIENAYSFQINTDNLQKLTIYTGLQRKF